MSSSLISNLSNNRVMECSDPKSSSSEHWLDRYVSSILRRKLKSFKCNECDESFSDESQQKIHFKKVHSKLKRLKPKPFKNFKCPVCSKCRKSKSKLRKHMKRKRHFKITSQSDSITDSNFAVIQDRFSRMVLSDADDDETVDHEDNVHSNSDTAKEERGYVHENECVPYPSASLRKQRIKIPCLRFSYAQFVKDNSHLYVCEICGLKCNDSSAFLCHRRSHVGELNKPYHLFSTRLQLFMRCYKSLSGHTSPH